MAAIEDPLSDEAIIASSFQNSSQTGDAGINTITSSFQNSRQTETAGDDSLLKTRDSLTRKRKYCSHCHEYVSRSTYRRHREATRKVSIKTIKAADDSSDEEFVMQDYVEQDDKHKVSRHEAYSILVEKGCETTGYIVATL